MFADDLQIAILPQFLALEPHFVQKGLRREPGNRNFTSVFGDRTSFRAKGFAGRLAILPQFLPHFVRKSCAGQVEIAILLQFLVIEHHFVRKGCVSCRLVGTAPAPRLQKRNRKEGEGKRARGQEEKM